jgi:hypothetical protein
MKMTNLFAGAALAAALATATTGAYASTLIGDSVHAEYLYPDTNTLYADLGTAVVGAGSPTYANVNGGNVLNIDITGSQIVFSWFGAGASSAGTFDGVEFTDTTHPFTNAVLDGVTNTPGILASAVTLVGGSIFVDLNNGVYSPEQNITVDVNGVGGVPEPATWAMLLLGMGGVGAAMRSRRRMSGAVSV